MLYLTRKMPAWGCNPCDGQIEICDGACIARDVALIKAGFAIPHNFWFGDGDHDTFPSAR